VIGKKGKDIAKEDAESFILGYALGLDITLRDVQQKAKQKGHPWVIAKGFDTSAPISDVIKKEMISDPHNLELELYVEGELRQKGNSGDMMLKIDEMISYLSTIFTLEPGDLIFTGTPEGVGEIKPGEKIRAEIKDIVEVEFNVAGES